MIPSALPLLLLTKAVLDVTCEDQDLRGEQGGWMLPLLCSRPITDRMHPHWHIVLYMGQYCEHLAFALEEQE